MSGVLLIFAVVITTICSGGLLGILWAILWVVGFSQVPDPSLPFVAALDDFERQLEYLKSPPMN